ncbi:MAG: hypothetical protein CMJ05_09815 [Pelagibacterales bacterium]|nr:hypothetical protein [Pelagibacterales bacterium]
MSKKMKTTITILILTINIGYSQNISDKELIIKSITFEEKKENYYEKIENDKMIDHIFSSFFFVYKTFISSQDGAVCSFHPSCSEYGITSIKKNGLLEGVLMTSDRLLRCNGLSPEKYDLIIDKNLLYDPCL